MSLAAHRRGTEAAQARHVKKAAVKPTTVTTELGQQTRYGGAVRQPIDTSFVMQTLGFAPFTSDQDAAPSRIRFRANSGGAMEGLSE